MFCLQNINYYAVYLLLFHIYQLFHCVKIETKIVFIPMKIVKVCSRPCHHKKMPVTKDIYHIWLDDNEQILLTIYQRSTNHKHSKTVTEGFQIGDKLAKLIIKRQSQCNKIDKPAAYVGTYICFITRIYELLFRFSFD